MSYIEPNSIVKIYTTDVNGDSVPFDVNMENTVLFVNQEQQYNYLETFRPVTLNKNSYTRMNRGVIKVGFENDIESTYFKDRIIAAVYNANYLAFKNTSFENKWFYAFIDSTEYLNNNTVTIAYHIDVIQTYMFDWKFNQCLIEREHTVSDLVGEHTLPEGLETGPYRSYMAECYMEDPLSPTGLSYMYNRFEYLRTVVLASSVDITNASFPKAYGVIIPNFSGQGGGGEYYSGIRYYSFPITDDYVYINELNRGLDELAGSADADAIVGIFMMPREFVPTNADEFEHGCQPKMMRVMRKATIDTYTPRNNKLFCYPYNMVYITNNTGNTAEYKVENFLDPQLQSYDKFMIWGNCSMTPGMFCAPMNYNGIINLPNLDDEIEVTGFPMCSYTIDSFKAWLAQNAGMVVATGASLGVGWATAIGKAYATSATGLINADVMDAYTPPMPIGNVLPAAYVGQHSLYSPKEMANLNSYLSGQSQNFTGLIGGTLAALGSLFDHSRKPPQVHGNNNASLAYQSGQLTFNWYYKQIRTEYAAIIDKFFDMYGYKTNRVGTPVLNARPSYSYIKTVGCSIDGMIPGDMKKIIENIFDKGVRFWQPHATFGNYDPDVNPNSPVVIPPEVGE